MIEHDGRSLSHEVLENYRFRAIELWKEGKKVNDISEFFGIHRCVVSRWISLYKRQGKEALKSKKAPGPDTKLAKEEKKKIIELIKKPATEYGFENPLWSCKKIKQLTKEKTGKDLHISNIWRWLVSWNMSPQKPERRAHEFNPKKWNKWLKTVWPEILEKAKKWQAIVYFHDECSVSLIAILGRTWAKKGKRPIVKVTGNKGSVMISSVISKGGRLLFRIEKENVTAEVFIGFIKSLMRHHKYRKFILVIDRAPAHTANKVKKFAEENKKRIAIYYFPSYSSHKNPDENTWGYLKKNEIVAHQEKTIEGLRKLARSKMRSIQKRPQVVKSFFHDSFVT